MFYIMWILNENILFLPQVLLAPLHFLEEALGRGFLTLIATLGVTVVWSQPLSDPASPHQRKIKIWIIYQIDCAWNLHHSVSCRSAGKTVRTANLICLCCGQFNLIGYNWTEPGSSDQLENKKANWIWIQCAVWVDREAGVVAVRWLKNSQLCSVPSCVFDK